MNNKLAKKLHKEGVGLFRKGNPEDALQKLTEALQNTDDQSQQAAEIYNDLGVIQSQLGDYEAAYQALDKAKDSFLDLGDEKGLAQTLGNRAAVYEAEGLTEDAVEAYKEAATKLEELGENDMAMYVWQAVSRLRMKQKQYLAAIGAYEEGVENMPQSSFKRKVMQQLLKAPGSLLGGSGPSQETDDDDDDNNEE